MPTIRQLTKTGDLQKGDQLVFGYAGNQSCQYPRKSSIWLLIQYLSTGVFQYLSIRDFFRVPGVPFASLPDAAEAGAGARAFCTDATAAVASAVVTVGHGSGTQYGYQSSYGGGTPFGSITDATFAPTGDTVAALWWASGLFDGLFLVLEGNVPNSGWTAVEVGGVAFPRAGATYFYDAINDYSSWNWDPVANPFGAEGEEDEIFYSPVTPSFNDPIEGNGSASIGVFSDGSIWRAG